MAYPYKFRRYSPIILHIYDYSCLVCNEKNKKLEIHHLDKNIHNNDGFNLIPLCVSCHKLIHSVSFLENIEISNDQQNQLVKFNLFMRSHL